MKLNQNIIANTKYDGFRHLAVFAVFFGLFIAFNGDAKSAASDYINSATYNNMQPFMNQKMRSSLRTSSSDSALDTSSTFTRSAVGSGNTPVSSMARSGSTTTSQRKVVARGGSTARSATVGNSGTTSQRRVIARSATNIGSSSSYRTTPSRTSAITTTSGRTVSARSSRGDSSLTSDRSDSEITFSTVSSTSVSPAQCLADYRTCMNGYCEREDAPYNKCYCSADLATIETTLRPEVENILQQLIIIKNGGMLSSGMSDAELEELWQDTFYTFTGTNDMSSLNTALDIEWPDEDSNMRGQNAFTIGHEYCVQHLKGCAYMASNLRDAYRSEISRDCTTYETYLNNIKIAGEAVISQVESETE